VARRQVEHVRDFSLARRAEHLLDAVERGEAAHEILLAAACVHAVAVVYARADAREQFELFRRQHTRLQQPPPLQRDARGVRYDAAPQRAEVRTQARRHSPPDLLSQSVQPFRAFASAGIIAAGERG
jgi:hypothetical protein